MNNLMHPKYPEGRNLFQDKNILITAAAGSGIGFSTAKRFLEEGANIFISDIHQGRLDEAIDNLRNINLGKVNGCLCNVTNDEEIDSMFTEAIACYSNLNGVINNAGLGGESALEDMTNDAWDLVMDVTLNGAMKIMRAAIPVLKDTQGVIVNNASVLGWRAQAGQSHYAAAKAGVMALTRCVALETVDYGIRINAVAPSLAMNPHLSKTSSDELIAELESKEAFGRGAEPWEIANIILFLASDLSSYMTGEVISASSQRS
ncbi:SDR family oxidoreductase [Gammaproteobacteria bacterium]|nr:SDR family oxidoreductase [Gammaproteobacteria bacterium]